MLGESPFLEIPPTDQLVCNRSAFAFFDRYPVTKGHVLVVTRRVVPTWWDASPEERADLMDLVQEVKSMLDEEFAPDGYNVGFNAGAAAGQTVPHLHVHVIPRRAGDMADPRGGVRHVIPSKGNYLARPNLLKPEVGLPNDTEVELLDDRDERLLVGLRMNLRDPSFDRVDFAVAFIRRSGLNLIEEPLLDCLQRGSIVRILTTDYLKYTEPAALRELLELSEDHEGQMAVRVFQDVTTSFHPKAYLFWSSEGLDPHIIVGSSNLTRSALRNGVEWNLASSAPAETIERFDELWRDPRSKELTAEWISSYEGEPDSNVALTQEVGEPPAQPVAPRPIQEEALRALEQTRLAGFKSGLVTMATGLGKTWLAAFDSNRPQFDRILFVAHREEILRQSRAVFRQVQPDAYRGLYFGKESKPDAKVVFASVQTLHRNLEQFEPDAFDYIVIDEFHHAAAPSYRKVLDHFSPEFLLGLTATPDRMDGADLLALCGDNLVFDCGLVEGIRREELVPFDYWGVPDPVDFEPIPWRGGRFDTEQLEQAIETQERTESAFNQWEQHGGDRTLAFCATTRHADFMARQFRERGVKCRSVHSGDTSDPRLESIEDLKEGLVEVIFAVDLFNEGLDAPEIDTVLMLRPTESPVVFLQQLGRGLRTNQGKSKLGVVDFIGNHRSFLSVPRTILSLGIGRTPSAQLLARAIETGDFGLPEGCSVNYDLESVELLSQLQSRSASSSSIAEYCLGYVEEEGVRPTATQAFHAGLDVDKARRKHGSWFGVLKELDILSDAEADAIENAGSVLSRFETEPINGPHKLITIRALLHEGALRDGLEVARIAEVCRNIVSRDPRLIKAMSTNEFPDPPSADSEAWEANWRKWPIDRLVSGSREPLFRLSGETLAPTFSVPDSLGDVFDAMVAEVIDYRLSKFLTDAPKTKVDAYELLVSHSDGSPALVLDRNAHPNLPSGEFEFVADGSTFRSNFAKRLVTTATKDNQPGNALPGLLRSWFGPSSGHPGTNHRVSLHVRGDEATLRPVSTSADSSASVIPLFPSFKVACGDFPRAEWGQHGGVPFEFAPRDLPPSSEVSNWFACFASGDSMDGGDDPIRNGDPLLFEWIDRGSRTDYLGDRVLVERKDRGGTAHTLKRLERVNGTYILRSDNPDIDDLEGDAEMRLVARLIRRTPEIEANPLAHVLGRQVKRAAVPELYGHEFNAGNWNSGHVSLADRVILFITLNKGSEMATGADYVDHFESPSELVWSSQASTEPDSKKGREVLESPANGKTVEAWVRRKKSDVAFTYMGRVVAMSHTGAKPMSVSFRMLTPVDQATWRNLHR